MKAIFFILLQFVSLSVVAQEEYIEISIIEDSIFFDKGGSHLSVSFLCKNTSTDTNFMLYGINSEVKNVPGSIDKLLTYKDKFTAGLVMYMYDSSNRRMGERYLIPPEIDHKPITKQTLDSVTAKSSMHYLNNSISISSGEQVIFTQTIDLKYFYLSNGRYTLRLIYFSGDRLVEKLGVEKIEEDLKSYNAELFKGVVYSNIISFTVYR